MQLRSLGKALNFQSEFWIALYEHSITGIDLNRFQASWFITSPKPLLVQKSRGTNTERMIIKLKVSEVSFSLNEKGTEPKSSELNRGFLQRADKGNRGNKYSREVGAAEGVDMSLLYAFL